MRLIPRSSLIITPDRQRKEFDPQKIAELSTSIDAKSLMHPIVVRETAAGPTLVAGESRVRAIDMLWLTGGTLRCGGEVIPRDMLPITPLGDLTELEAEEAELEENLHRTNLTWQEEAAAKSKLHRIRSAQAQAAGRVHTVADTAMELKGRSDGSFQESIRKELIVAKHLDNPEVAKAKTPEEAFKILKRQEQVQQNLRLAETVGKSFTQSIHEIHNVNCLDWLRRSEPGIVDVILTDPPYGMGADSFGDGGDGRLANNTHHYKDDRDSWEALMREWAPLSYRIAKPEAHAYVFCDIDNFPLLRTIMQEAGWFVTRTPFICTKPGSGRVPHPEFGPRRQWEMILYAVKGKKRTQGIYPDVITTTADEGLLHGAQKPVALFEDLLRRSVVAGNVVLDCFAGSGTVLPAAHRYKCKAIALEMNPEYYGICVKRGQTLDEGGLATGQGAALGNELLAMLQR